ncbi:unnamed protein product [Prunus armeniaca]
MFVICLFDHVGSFRDMLVPRMVSTFQEMCNLSTLEIMSDPEFFEPKTDYSRAAILFKYSQSLHSQRTELALAVTASSSRFGTGKRANRPRRPPSRLAPAKLLPRRLSTA